MRSGETPLLARYVRTASARACDKRVLVAADPVLSVWPEISILIPGLAMSDAATMSRIVYESGFSAERPVSNVTPRSTTGVFASEKTPVVLRGVTFETGRSALKPDSYTILDIVAASLIANPEIKIEIGGHTDNTGAAATNTRLSQARADAVRTYLASKGVSPDRMVARGYGPTQPVAPNTTAAGRAQNRRVELRQTN